MDYFSEIFRNVLFIIYYPFWVQFNVFQPSNGKKTTWFLIPLNPIYVNIWKLGKFGHHQLRAALEEAELEVCLANCLFFSPQSYNYLYSSCHACRRSLKEYYVTNGLLSLTVSRQINILCERCGQHLSRETNCHCNL